jgi:tRNA threonylcarbamoyladenosine biosynthesis protein TsaE
VLDRLTRSESETEGLAADLARSFRGGEVVLLTGELGAGKTAFVRGLARGLGAEAGEVASPTFVYLTSYSGRLELHHADLYRLSGRRGEEELGLEELPGTKGVLAVEWAERLTHAPWKDPYRVRLSHEGADARRVQIEGGAL